MSEKIQVKLRVTQEVADQLKKEAEKQKRSVNNLLEVMIDEYLQKQNDSHRD